MDLQYPIGKFAWNRTGEGLLASEAERQEWLARHRRASAETLS